jgi:hypothetical protein
MTVVRQAYRLFTWCSTYQLEVPSRPSRRGPYRQDERHRDDNYPKSELRYEYYHPSPNEEYHRQKDVNYRGRGRHPQKTRQPEGHTLPAFPRRDLFSRIGPPPRERSAERLSLAMRLGNNLPSVRYNGLDRRVEEESDRLYYTQSSVLIDRSHNSQQHRSGKLSSTVNLKKSIALITCTEYRSYNDEHRPHGYLEEVPDDHAHLSRDNVADAYRRRDERKASIEHHGSRH